MAETILSNFGLRWPAGIQEMDLRKAVNSVFEGEPKQTKVNWYHAAINEIKSGSLDARLKEGSPERTEQQWDTKSVSASLHGPQIKSVRIPAVADQYFIKREDFHKWLIDQTQNSANQESDLEPNAFPLRKPERERESTWVVYSAAKKLFDRNNEMPRSNEIFHYLKAGKDETGSVDKSKLNDCKSEIVLHDGTKLRTNKITRTLTLLRTKNQ